MPITLLNIDKGLDRSSDEIIKELYEQIDQVYDLLDTFGDKGIPAPKLVILRNRMKDLQDLVADFGELSTMSMKDKQSLIFELHPQLLSLANSVYGYDEEVNYIITSCISYLLNLLCSGAAANPKSVVIGVSNILAQVLSQEVGVDSLPEITCEKDDPKFFSLFTTYYNFLLTSAGIYAAPVVGLPGITISALGNWSEKSLRQFGFLRKFIQNNFVARYFYEIDKKNHSTKQFDTTKDILTSMLYENEFLVQLASRADLISGIEFPAEFTLTGETQSFKSADEITLFICDKILDNSQRIFSIITDLEKLYQDGLVNRNENPYEDDELLHIKTISGLWFLISKLGYLMNKIFYDSSQVVSIEPSSIDIPPADPADEVQQTLLNILGQIIILLDELKGGTDEQSFIQSSKFSTYRIFFHYLLYLVALNDLILEKPPIINWFIEKFSSFFTKFSIEFTTLETLLLGQILVFLGFKHSDGEQLRRGKELLIEVEPYFEFQTHHLVTIKLLKQIVLMFERGEDMIKNKEVFQGMISSLIEQYEIPQESMLFYKLRIYSSMIDIYFQDSNKDIIKQYQRLVPFDIFTWINLPIDFTKDFIWLPMNSSVENLNMG